MKKKIDHRKIYREMNNSLYAKAYSFEDEMSYWKVFNTFYKLNSMFGGKIYTKWVRPHLGFIELQFKYTMMQVLFETKCEGSDNLIAMCVRWKHNDDLIKAEWYELVDGFYWQNRMWNGEKFELNKYKEAA